MNAHIYSAGIRAGTFNLKSPGFGVLADDGQGNLIDAVGQVVATLDYEIGVVSFPAGPVCRSIDLVADGKSLPSSLVAS